MSSRREWKRRRRAKLFIQQHGKCFWCEEPMIFLNPYPQKGMLPPNACTIDHLRDRENPLRRQFSRGEQRLVAACHACNGERDKARRRCNAVILKRAA